nr:hypothetical protein OH820_28500 [Streptomyces sp. NBC_00857]
MESITSSPPRETKDIYSDKSQVQEETAITLGLPYSAPTTYPSLISGFDSF